MECILSNSFAYVRGVPNMDVVQIWTNDLKTFLNSKLFFPPQATLLTVKLSRVSRPSCIVFGICFNEQRFKYAKPSMSIGTSFGPSYCVTVKLGSLRIKCGLASDKISKLASAEQTSSTRFILNLIEQEILKVQHVSWNRQLILRFT